MQLPYIVDGEIKSIAKNSNTKFSLLGKYTNFSKFGVAKIYYFAIERVTVHAL